MGVHENCSDFRRLRCFIFPNTTFSCGRSPGVCKFIGCLQVVTTKSKRLCKLPYSWFLNVIKKVENHVLSARPEIAFCRKSPCIRVEKVGNMELPCSSPGWNSDLEVTVFRSLRIVSVPLLFHGDYFPLVVNPATAGLHIDLLDPSLSLQINICSLTQISTCFVSQIDGFRGCQAGCLDRKRLNTDGQFVLIYGWKLCCYVHRLLTQL